MLKNLNPLLSPDLLYALRAMGHLQDIAIVDANFPCAPSDRVIRLDGVPALDVLSAVLSVLPLETQEPACAWRMVANGRPEQILPVFADFERVVDESEPGASITALDPADFKQLVGDSAAIVITGERRLYGSIVVRKGVIGPD
ncbi:MAG TPA: RbsD/FucU domain-containing protein [Thermomicrobiales bacterium]|nr:RbsD/FucU domain-containing protein [Thermomicrobiales bacterium]